MLFTLCIFLVFIKNVLERIFKDFIIKEFQHLKATLEKETLKKNLQAWFICMKTEGKSIFIS